MGRQKNTPNRSQRARPQRRPRNRTCLCKGCGNRFKPKRYTQRFCLDPPCQKRVRQWHSRKRQQKRRATPQGKEKHRMDERRRRRQQKLAKKKHRRKKQRVGKSGVRGHAEGKPRCGPICDRPGCYVPVKESPQKKATYCSKACRRAVWRVKDRERKWRRRARAAEQRKRRREYDRARKKMKRRRLRGSKSAVMGPLPPAISCRSSAIGYGRRADYASRKRREVRYHEPKKDTHPFRSRSPPSG